MDSPVIATLRGSSRRNPMIGLPAEGRLPSRGLGYLSRLSIEQCANANELCTAICVLARGLAVFVAFLFVALFYPSVLSLHAPLYGGIGDHLRIENVSV